MKIKKAPYRYVYCFEDRICQFEKEILTEINVILEILLND